MSEHIFVKKENESCLYCVSCGKQELYMSAANHEKFACASCGSEFIINPGDKKCG